MLNKALYGHTGGCASANVPKTLDEAFKHRPLPFARGIWCMTITVEVVVSSSTSRTRHSVVVVVTEMDEELKAHSQTKTMPYRVRNQTVGTVRHLARGK